MTSELPATDRAPRHRLWLIVLIVVAVAYAALTVAIIVGSPLDRLDALLYHLHLVPKKSSLRTPVELYVLIGQGVPASTIAALYAIRRSIKTRTWTPWVMFAVALFLLNASVGVMKHATGRLGPKETSVVHTVWDGGTIFPSGHAANAIVMYGLIAMIAPAAHRRVVTTIAVVLSTTIGLGTVALNTHWISDVFGGWLAGALVLLVVPPLTRPLDRLVTKTANRLRPILVRWWASSPFRPLGTPKPSANRVRRATEAESAATATAFATAAPPGPTTTGAAATVATAGAGDPAAVSDRPATTADDRLVAGRADAGDPTTRRSHAVRHTSPTGSPVGLGPRSPLRDRRHHSLTQGS